MRGSIAFACVFGEPILYEFSVPRVYENSGLERGGRVKLERFC